MNAIEKRASGPFLLATLRQRPFLKVHSQGVVVHRMALLAVGLRYQVFAQSLELGRLAQQSHSYSL